MTDQPHISTKDRPGDYDAIESAKPGEPLFPLQGGDPLAPGTVQFWADYARAQARACLSGGKVRIPRVPFEIVDEPDGYEPSEEDKAAATKLLHKATQAEEVSWAFTAYQRGDEEPTGGRATYNDAGPSLAEDAQAAMDERKALITYAGRLNNAVGIASSVAEGLAKRRVLPLAEVKVREAVDSLREAAREVEPRRGRERS
jgi:hypothetical protein